MRIIIEVAGGMVGGVYADGAGTVPEVLVVDLDGGAVGQATYAVGVPVEPLENASDLVLEALDNLPA